jgi:hypothetical protein
MSGVLVAWRAEMGAKANTLGHASADDCSIGRRQLEDPLVERVGDSPRGEGDAVADSSEPAIARSRVLSGLRLPRRRCLCRGRSTSASMCQIATSMACSTATIPALPIARLLHAEAR